MRNTGPILTMIVLVVLALFFEIDTTEAMARGGGSGGGDGYSPALRRQAFDRTNTSAPRSAKKIPLYQRRIPSAKTKMTTATTILAGDSPGRGNGVVSTIQYYLDG